MAAVSAINLTIHKGTYFEETFALAVDGEQGANLSGSYITAKLKKHPTATTSYPFATTLTIADSTVKVSMASSITAGLPSGRCVYDILVTDSSGFTSKVVEGTILVQETVSA